MLIRSKKCDFRLNGKIVPIETMSDVSITISTSGDDLEYCDFIGHATIGIKDENGVLSGRFRISGAAEVVGGKVQIVGAVSINRE